MSEAVALPARRDAVPEDRVAIAIATRHVVKRYGATIAVDRASVEVGRGELVALLGPSGSGKTSLLRVIAGFERPDAGVVEIGGTTVAGPGAWVEPERRRIGMVFQHGALFPHLSVADNVAFGAARAERARERLELVGLGARAGSFPHELSGGERQRVALARALAADPDVVLLDEPFASLDAGLRESLRADVAAIIRATGASALLVTHDQGEALSLADRVAVMRAGRVLQAGTPAELYHRPASRWVAGFLGDANVLAGTARDGVVECELGRFPADEGLAGAVDVIVRPEAVALAPASDDAATATVVEQHFFGHDHLVTLRLASGAALQSRLLGHAGFATGDRVAVVVAGGVVAIACDAGIAQEPEPVGATAR